MQVGILERALIRGPEMLKACQTHLVVANHQRLAYFFGRYVLFATHQRGQVVLIIEHHTSGIAPVATMGFREGAGQRFFQRQHGKAGGPQGGELVGVGKLRVLTHRLLQQRQGQFHLAFFGPLHAFDGGQHRVLWLGGTHHIHIELWRVGGHVFLRQQLAHVFVDTAHGQNQRPGDGAGRVGINALACQVVGRDG